MESELDNLRTTYGNSTKIPLEDCKRFLFKAYFHDYINMEDINISEPCTIDELKEIYDVSVQNKKFKETKNKFTKSTEEIVENIKNRMAKANNAANFGNDIEAAAYFQNINFALDAFMTYLNNRYKRIDYCLGEAKKKYSNLKRMIKTGIILMIIFFLIWWLDIFAKPL